MHEQPLPGKASEMLGLGTTSSISGPNATLHNTHHSYQFTFPLLDSYSYLLSLFYMAIKYKLIVSLSCPYFMSSSLAKITMALALGVSRSCLIILSKSMVLSLRSWGIFRDWAMQSPPGWERRKKKEEKGHVRGEQWKCSGKHWKGSSRWDHGSDGALSARLKLPKGFTPLVFCTDHSLGYM